MRVKYFFLLLFRRHVEVSIYLIVEFHECLLSFIIESIDTDSNCLCLISEDAVSTDDMDQTTGGDDFLNAAIVEGLADDICPIYKTLAEVGSNNIKIASNIGENLDLICRRGILLFKCYWKTLQEASLSTLVPMNRPSSEPLPLVFAVAMTLKPAVGWTNLPIFLRKTPFPSRILWRQRILLEARSISSRSRMASLECFND